MALPTEKQTDRTPRHWQRCELEPTDRVLGAAYRTGADTQEIEPVRNRSSLATLRPLTMAHWLTVALLVAMATVLVVGALR